ncbi:hypothetical protein PGTUg99_031781 [Puccinia graminis f. sp. tritici]|uniref:Uncharacterized protein n=1 Tax=Puccinia graminis f. sp. tritici TaxID=56615 RepID=A0A5B0P635_PUCGR|nr:hypothetical protein PGTUg99_031781 [Puccinia graminis f. sp. tritici]
MLILSESTRASRSRIYLGTESLGIRIDLPGQSLQAVDTGSVLEGLVASLPGGSVPRACFKFVEVQRNDHCALFKSNLCYVPPVNHACSRLFPGRQGNSPRQELHPPSSSPGRN